MKEYFYLDGNNQQIGPISQEGLKALKNAGVISNQTQIWAEDLPYWLPYSNVFREIKQQPAATKNKQSTPREGASKWKRFLWIGLVIILITIKIVMLVHYIEQKEERKRREKELMAEDFRALTDALENQRREHAQAASAARYYDSTARERCSRCSGTGVTNTGTPLSVGYGNYQMICPQCNGTGMCSPAQNRSYSPY